MNKFLIAVVGSLALIALSCSKTSEQALDPSTSSCDTVNMKYSANVVPILQSICYDCHSLTTNGISGGIILEGYSNLKFRVDNGDLIGAITHAPGYTPMPFELPKLSDCDINTIRSWINNGAQNN